MFVPVWFHWFVRSKKPVPRSLMLPPARQK